MPKSSVFHLNYYVGAVLAQGGDMWFDETKIFFSPTSAIDRALGATDVEIPLLKIQGVEYKGDLMRSFHVKTEDKVHRFQGSQAKNAWTALAQSLQAKGMRPMSANPIGAPTQPAPAASKSSACLQCSGRIEPNFIFCPFCGTRLK